MTQERRTKIVPISPSLLHELFTTSEQAMTSRCSDGLPADARFITHHYDVMRNMHYLVFESDQWDVVCEGCQSPYFNPAFTRYHIAPTLEKAAALIRDSWDGTAPTSAGNAWLAEYAEFEGRLS